MMITAGKNIAGIIFLTFAINAGFGPAAFANTFRAGAYAVDISPTKLPTHLAGMFLDRTSSALLDHLHARCLVLDDEHERVAIVIVDSVGLPREVLDPIKDIIQSRTGIRTDHVLISATHTHSAPSTLSLLGTPPDKDYIQLLIERIPQGVEEALKNLVPARFGWKVIQDWDHTHTRRWIRRPDKVELDPFGDRTVRANMHPGYMNPDVIGPSGPSDPDLSIVSFQALDGRPVALLANYGQHYYGEGGLVNEDFISADYYGLFANRLADLIAPGRNPEDTGASASALPPFVGMMSQGTSGDQMWMDYGKPENSPGIDAYARAIAQEVYAAYQEIEYKTEVTLRMAETRLTLGVRIPDQKRLEWAHEVVAEMKSSSAANIPQVYALHALAMQNLPPTEEVKLQAIRIGDVGITAIPNEVYALTGLKVKAQSPLAPTINIELANGYEGYLPPPEQHKLGGYTTWPHQHLRLEYDAEPKIVDATVKLLESVAGKNRRPIVEPNGPYAHAVLEAKPWAYWRLNEFSGPVAHDATGRRHDGDYEDGIAFYLPGPESKAFSDEQMNRAPHLAGGRIHRTAENLPDHWAVEFWFWNGLPTDIRPVTGWLLSLHSAQGSGFALGLGGKGNHEGKLILGSDGAEQSGASPLALKTWSYLAIVREGHTIKVYVNGNQTPEITSGVAPMSGPMDIFLGGGADKSDSFEGKLDEVAIYDRTLSPLEISDHFRLAAMH